MTAIAIVSATKICNTCGANKERKFFSAFKRNKEGLQAQCKACCASYYQANKAKLAEKAAAYRQANRSDTSNRMAAYTRTRRATDPVFAMRTRVSSLIGFHLRRGGYTKKSRSHEILGCDWETFVSHLERQFLKGMTWENRGAWQIDHIVPLSTAQTEEEILALNHFTNLRPMWAKDNLSKGAQITHLI